MLYGIQVEFKEHRKMNIMENFKCEYLDCICFVRNERCFVHKNWIERGEDILMLLIWMEIYTNKDDMKFNFVF